MGVGQPRALTLAGSAAPRAPGDRGLATPPSVNPNYADVAQQAERDVANVEAAGSIPVVRSIRE